MQLNQKSKSKLRVNSVSEIMAASIPCNSVEVDAQEETTEPLEIQEKAKAFINSVVNLKETPLKAAKDIGTTIERIQSNAEMKAAITRLLDIATVSPEMQQQIVRAGRLKIFMDNLESDPKIALDASKQIASDLNMGTGETPGVVINIGSELKEKLSGLTLEGISAPNEES